MNNISLHITKLLFDNQQVIIAGLGVFTSQEQKAYKHPVSHDFTPKSKIISFKFDDKAKDDNLALAIASANADKLIADFVAEILKTLSEGKNVELNNLGVLKKHDKGNIVFEQDKNTVFDKAFFGLAAFNQEPIQKHEPVIIPVAKPEEEESKKKLWIWFVAFFAVAGILIAILYFTTDILPFGNDNRMANNETAVVEQNDEGDTKSEVVQNTEVADNDTIDGENKVNVDSSDKVVVVDELSIEIDSVRVQEANSDIVVNEEIVEENTEVVEPPVEEAVVQDIETNNKYFVIAGCFRSEKKAEDYLEGIKKSGYSNALIKGKTSGGLIRVCYGGFERRSEANKFLHETMAKEGKSLWVQKITK